MGTPDRPRVTPRENLSLQTLQETESGRRREPKAAGPGEGAALGPRVARSRSEREANRSWGRRFGLRRPRGAGRSGRTAPPSGVNTACWAAAGPGAQACYFFTLTLM